MKKHVAGVAMGMIQEPDKTVVLTDILGNEDHMGDMDFKSHRYPRQYYGLSDGCKSIWCFRRYNDKALEQAKVARLKILDLMYRAVDTLERLCPIMHRSSRRCASL